MDHPIWEEFLACVIWDYSVTIVFFFYCSACVWIASSISGRRVQRLVEERERHVTGVAGKNVVLRCDLPTSNPASVRWIDYVYNQSPQPQRIYVRNQVQQNHPNADKFQVDSEFSLTISSLRVDESPGQYVCESVVDGQTHRLTYQLTVCSTFHIIVLHFTFSKLFFFMPSYYDVPFYCGEQNI